MLNLGVLVPSWAMAGGDAEFRKRLQNAALNDVNLSWHRVNLDAEFARCFINKVNCFVWKKAISQVTVRKHRCTNKC
jgi:hypothetical protein